jgi:hypothetical protein
MLFLDEGYFNSNRERRLPLFLRKWILIKDQYACQLSLDRSAVESGLPAMPKHESQPGIAATDALKV